MRKLVSAKPLMSHERTVETVFTRITCAHTSHDERRKFIIACVMWCRLPASAVEAMTRACFSLPTYQRRLAAAWLAFAFARTLSDAETLALTRAMKRVKSSAPKLLRRLSMLVVLPEEPTSMACRRCNLGIVSDDSGLPQHPSQSHSGCNSELDSAKQ